MEEFYVDVELSRGMTRIQVDEVLPEHWDLPAIPQFIIEYYSDHEFVTLTIQLEDGAWTDRDHPFSSVLSPSELLLVGRAISNYMVVRLTAYMGLFIPSFRNPTLN